MVHFCLVLGPSTPWFANNSFLRNTFLRTVFKYMVPMFLKCLLWTTIGFTPSIKYNMCDSNNFFTLFELWCHSVAWCSSEPIDLFHPFSNCRLTLSGPLGQGLPFTSRFTCSQHNAEADCCLRRRLDVAKWSFLAWGVMTLTLWDS